MPAMAGDPEKTAAWARIFGEAVKRLASRKVFSGPDTRPGDLRLVLEMGSRLAADVPTDPGHIERLVRDFSRGLLLAAGRRTDSR